jgi:hypothetical protein
MASMMECQQCAEEECEDHHVQQQQSQIMMAAMMATSFMGRTGPAQTHHPRVGDDEADDSWDIIGSSVGKPKDDHD